MRVFVAIFVYLVFASHAYASPSFQDVKSSYEMSDAVLLDRHGEVIHEMRVNQKGRRLDWIALKDISQPLTKAVIHSEDRMYYEHRGVDWKAIGSAVLKNFFTKSSRGASTITMQLASILNRELRPGKSKRTLIQKWEQIKAARNIERAWSKDEILEAYLNLVSFKGELQGISAASRGIFDKEPAGLTMTESVLLASLIRSPNASVYDVSKRACLLSSSLKWASSCDEIKMAAQTGLSRPYRIKPRIADAPHAARELLSGGSTAVSTLDGDTHRFSAEILRRQLNELQKQNVHDGAVLVANNRTGEILAYISSSDEFSSARHVDGIKAKRQAGSALKPFLYGLAIESKLLTAASVLDDSPLSASTQRGIYMPKNYDNEYRGEVSVRTALSSSLNIPAVRTLMLVGTERFAIRLRQVGVDGIYDGGYYGLSMALGSVDVSLYELVNAYRVLANKGRWSELTLIRNKKNERIKQVMPEDAAFIVSDILSDREARSATFGFENPLSTRFWTAVKTGTSKDMRDNWCIGFSSKYTVGVWVGNFSGSPMWNVSGVSGAASVWLEVMNYLHRNTPSTRPEQPSGVSSKKIAFTDRKEPERDEWFIKGTERESPVKTTTVYERPRITYPINESIIAIDPDIPEGHQFIPFQFKPDSMRYEWVLNNRETGMDDSTFLWKPEHGKHTVSIIDNNLIIDTVEFVVR